MNVSSAEYGGGKVFGGAGETSVPEVIKAQKGECDRRDQYIEFDLPAYGAVIFEFSL